jgi:hypothetical protein
MAGIGRLHPQGDGVCQDSCRNFLCGLSGL